MLTAPRQLDPLFSNTCSLLNLGLASLILSYKILTYLQNLGLVD